MDNENVTLSGNIPEFYLVSTTELNEKITIYYEIKN